MTAEVIVVVGARGGCGASTLAALLARERASTRGVGRVGARPGRVALVDLDHGHGGIEVLLGIEDRAGARWPDLAQVRGTFAATDLDGLLPVWDGVEVLGADRRDGAPSTDTLDAVWGALVDGCSTVVVDVPARSVVDGRVPQVLADRTALVLITPQDVLGVSGAAGVVAVLGGGAGHVVAGHVVLWRRGRPRVSPAEVGAVLGLPVLARLPTDRGLAEAVDRGLGPLLRPWSPVPRAVRRIAGALSEDRLPARRRAVRVAGTGRLRRGMDAVRGMAGVEHD